MNNYCHMIANLKTPEVMKQLTNLYGQRDGMLVKQIMRYTELIKRHEKEFNHSAGLRLISAPGRAEIGGNHTDHNRGKVLTAAVNLDTVAAVSPRDDLLVHLNSEGYAPMTVDLNQLEPCEEEKNTTISLIRGVAAGFKNAGFHLGGFDAVVTSEVKSGSGLSSSAAFEVLLCAILDNLYGGNRLTAEQRAMISQYAENRYFGKPSGLLDQMASSVGGLCFIDFRDEKPEIQPISYDFSEKGYAMVVVATGGCHDDLTDCYTAIPNEMHALARYFGVENLREIQPEKFIQAIPQIRSTLKGTLPVDRAILRALHFFNENQRAQIETDALIADDLQRFFASIIESGRSSFCYLQNVYPDENHEEIPLALMLAETYLRKGGAWRVHGGGFAGTTLNFVPISQVTPFVDEMSRVFGQHSCSILDVRPVGPAVIQMTE